MGTVDTGEVRRQLEQHATMTGTGYPAFLSFWRSAERLLAYLPILLDELDQLRAMRTKVVLLLESTEQAKPVLASLPGGSAAADFAQATANGLRAFLEEVDQ